MAGSGATGFRAALFALEDIEQVACMLTQTRRMLEYLLTRAAGRQGDKQIGNFTQRLVLKYLGLAKLMKHGQMRGLLGQRALQVRPPGGII